MGVILCQFPQVEVVIEAAIHMVMVECSALKIPGLLKKKKDFWPLFSLFSTSLMKDMHLSCNTYSMSCLYLVLTCNFYLDIVNIGYNYSNNLSSAVKYKSNFFFLQ